MLYLTPFLWLHTAWPVCSHFTSVQRVCSIVCTCKIDVKMAATHIYIGEHHHSTWHPVCISISPRRPACIQGYKRRSGLSQVRIRPETNRVVCPRRRNYLQGQTGSAVQCVNTRLQPLILAFTRVWSGGFSAGWGMWIHCTLHTRFSDTSWNADKIPPTFQLWCSFRLQGALKKTRASQSKRQRDFIHISNL